MLAVSVPDSEGSAEPGCDRWQSVHRFAILVRLARAMVVVPFQKTSLKQKQEVVGLLQTEL
jgi:hypothetical protein